MAYEYSAQNHDWDLTLRAAVELINMGLFMDSRTKSRGFSFFTGGMVLSFAAIESFSASVAFSMQSDDRFRDFDFQRYQKERRFWNRMEILMSAAGIEVDKGKGLFQQIERMQQWRNLVTHASPYEIPPTAIADTTKTPGKLHQNKRPLEYVRMADRENATKFYETAVAYINLVKERTGHDPRASATYRVLE